MGAEDRAGGCFRQERLPASTASPELKRVLQLANNSMLIDVTKWTCRAKHCRGVNEKPDQTFCESRGCSRRQRERLRDEVHI